MLENTAANATPAPAGPLVNGTPLPPPPPPLPRPGDLGTPTSAVGERWTDAEEIFLLSAIIQHKTPGAMSMNKVENAAFLKFVHTIGADYKIRLNKAKDSIDVKITALKSKISAWQYVQGLNWTGFIGDLTTGAIQLSKGQWDLLLLEKGPNSQWLRQFSTGSAVNNFELLSQCWDKNSLATGAHTVQRQEALHNDGREIAAAIQVPEIRNANGLTLEETRQEDRGDDDEKVRALLEIVIKCYLSVFALMLEIAHGTCQFD